MKITYNLKTREVNTISPKLSYYYTKVIMLDDRSKKNEKKAFLRNQNHHFRWMFGVYFQTTIFSV